MHLRGLPISPGIAIGKPFFFNVVDDVIPQYEVPEEDVQEELARYQEALQKCREEVVFLQKDLQRQELAEGANILEAHLGMLEDPFLTDDVERKIKESKKNAEYVFHTLMEQYAARFQGIEDPFFQERFKDVVGISRRILSILRKTERSSLVRVPKGSIVFAYELTASDTAEADTDAVAAFVTASGGSTSHAAIVAKAKGIPYVTNVEFERDQVLGGKSAVVDGRTGDILIDPAEGVLYRYEEIQKKLDHLLTTFQKKKATPIETYDGFSVRLSANIETVGEVEILHKYGGHGVGLFRSEYIFLSQEGFPSEEEQFEIYREVVEKMEGKPIVIRTFDIGGDKLILTPSSLKGKKLLGSFQYLLQEQDIFKTQLRAILRASTFGAVSIMFPMVSRLQELLEAKRLVMESAKELGMLQGGVMRRVRIGCMIETPSAALISDALARESDFLSLGTNDLVQFTLATDRESQGGQENHSPAHPSVIRLIKLVVTQANLASIPVSICGEAAADPRFTPLLLGLGIQELSVAPRFLPVVKHAIRSSSITEAADLAERVLALTSEKEIEEFLSETYQRNVPEDFFCPTPY